MAIGVTKNIAICVASASEVLRSEFLNRPTSKLEERVAAIKLTEEIEDEELLLEFLLHLKQRKQEVADRLRDSICFISADVQEVQDQRSILLQNSYPELDTGGRSATSTLDHPVADVDSSCFASRKRFRSEFNNGVGEEELGHLMAEAPRSGTELQIQVSIASKSSRLMKNFKKLEAAYFSTRRRGSRSTRRPESKQLQGTSSGTGSAVRTERSSVDDVVLQEGRGGGRRNEWINPFLEGLCKYLSFSRLKVKADLKQGDLLNSMNLVCSMDFDRDNEFFATAGVNKKIKVFECDMILNEDRGIHYPVVEMSNRSKLSCICWNGYIKSQIASSDFEGVVQVATKKSIHRSPSQISSLPTHTGVGCDEEPKPGGDEGAREAGVVGGLLPCGPNQAGQWRRRWYREAVEHQ